MSATSRAMTVATHPLDVPVRLARGVWLPGEADEELDRVRRFAEALPCHSVVVDRSAAVLRGWWLPPANDPVRLDFASSVPGRKGSQLNRSRRPELIGSRRQFEPGDIVDFEGLAVTSPARTWIDLARRLSLVELVALGDSILRDGTSQAALEAMVQRNPRRRGVVNARLALPLLDARSRSRPESHLRVELIRPGWPVFEVNTWIKDANGGWLAEPDLSNEQYAVAVEYQGSQHAEDRRMRKDLTRNVDVVGSRWLSLPVGPSEVFRHQHRLRAAVAALLHEHGWPGPQLTPAHVPVVARRGPRRVGTSRTDGRQ